MTRTSEQAFETYVQHVLLVQSDWRQGKLSDWDKGSWRVRASSCCQVLALIFF